VAGTSTCHSSGVPGSGHHVRGQPRGQRQQRGVRRWPRCRPPHWGALQRSGRLTRGPRGDHSGAAATTAGGQSAVATCWSGHTGLPVEGGTSGIAMGTTRRHGRVDGFALISQAERDQLRLQVLRLSEAGSVVLLS
jgi:hypothetical protein